MSPVSLPYPVLCQALEPLRVNCSRGEMGLLSGGSSGWEGLQKKTGGLTFPNTLSVSFPPLSSEEFVFLISQLFRGSIGQISLFLVGIWRHLVAAFYSRVLPYRDGQSCFPSTISAEKDRREDGRPNSFLLRMQRYIHLLAHIPLG